MYRALSEDREESVSVVLNIVILNTAEVSFTFLDSTVSYCDRRNCMFIHLNTKCIFSCVLSPLHFLCRILFFLYKYLEDSFLKVQDVTGNETLETVIMGRCLI